MTAADLAEWIDNQPSTVKERCRELARRSHAAFYAFLMQVGSTASYEEAVDWAEGLISKEVKALNMELADRSGVDPYAAMSTSLGVAMRLVQRLDDLMDDGDPIVVIEAESRLSSALGQVKAISAALDKMKSHKSFESGVMAGLGKAKMMMMAHPKIHHCAIEGDIADIWRYIFTAIAEELITPKR